MHAYSSRPDEFDAIVIGAGFSGHGFNFASVVGEIMADLVTEGKTRYPSALFRPERFARA